MNVLQEKKQIREQMRDLRRSLLEAEKLSRSERICDFLIADLVARKPGKLFAYLALKEEPNLEVALKMAQKLGWEVTVPALRSETEMVAAKLSENRTRTSFGFEEPDVIELVSPDELDLLWIPGTAFDFLGFRLGMGGGFYDRFLPYTLKADWIGICWSFQMIDKVPCEDHDRKMNIIINEQEVVKISSKFNEMEESGCVNKV